MDSYIERLKLRGGGVCRYRGAMQLIAHPDTKVATVQEINVAVWRNGDQWHFRYLVEGSDDLILADPLPAERTDGLWKRTCFEAFVGLRGESYAELNFSPSSQWAMYQFDSCRSGRREAPAEVEIWLDAGDGWLALEAAVKSEVLSAGASMGLSAVIEEHDGTSYWALAHGDGPPDFHDRTCFKALLADIAHS